MFDFSSMIYTVPALLIAITIHEYAHALTADAMGDPTPRYLGRLTFNPLAHLDILGAIMLALFHFGWAKPVPINPARMNHPRKGIIWTSLAGPLSNLLAALVGVILMQIVFPFYHANPNAVLTGIYLLLYWFANINISLAVFNLIPVPPLDGSRILLAVLPERIYFGMMKYERVILIVLLAAVWGGFLDGPLSVMNNVVWDLLDNGTQYIDTIAYSAYYASTGTVI